MGVFKDGSGEFFIAIVSRDGNGRMLLGPEPEKEEDLIRQMRAGRDTEMERRIRSVVENANACVGCFVSDKSATPPALPDVAGHAIRLAKLDVLARVGLFNPSFEEAAQEDIKNLLEMLDLVPFEQLLHDKIVLLNPTFGEVSKWVGCDGDLISGDLLVDFKTTIKSAMQPNDLDQLLGYFLLSRYERRSNPTFPEIKRAGLYFARHGHLWVIDVATWTNLPEFAEIEQWVVARVEAQRAAIFSYLLPGARKKLLQLGKGKFGKIDAASRGAIGKIRNLQDLEKLAEKVSDAKNWRELLGLPPPRRKQNG